MEESNKAKSETRAESAAAVPYADARIVDADQLFASHREVFIRNGDAIYRLRRTRQGKLILNK